MDFPHVPELSETPKNLCPLEKKPSRFDRNLIVIGAGAAGLVLSYIAAATGSEVTQIERAPGS